MTEISSLSCEDSRGIFKRQQSEKKTSFAEHMMSSLDILHLKPDGYGEVLKEQSEPCDCNLGKTKSWGNWFESSQGREVKYPLLNENAEVEREKNQEQNCLQEGEKSHRKDRERNQNVKASQTQIRSYKENGRSSQQNGTEQSMIKISKTNINTKNKNSLVHSLCKYFHSFSWYQTQRYYMNQQFYP